MEKTKIQWHPGFIAAMGLEFREDRDGLEFESEHNLNRKPLGIDLLVIKKDASMQVSNEIGEFFRGHNIVEYKSPDDSLDIDVFYKVGAYAGLYKSYGKSVDERKADDITVSIIRDVKPVKLFSYLEGHGHTISSPHRGIYRVEGNVLFPTQVVVTGEFGRGEHAWLRSLSRKLGEDDILGLLEERRKMGDAPDRELADSVLEVALEANSRLFEQWRGDAAMFETLMEIFEPQIQMREEKIRKESIEIGKKKGEIIGEKRGEIIGEKRGEIIGEKRGIQGAIELLREFGQKDADIKEAIKEKYGLTEEEAGGYM